jgi:hypothetical protein
MEGNAMDKVKEAYEVLLQWEADDAAGVAGTTDKPEAKSASEALFAVRMLLQDALRMPLRNCEVGTVEEQVKRYDKFCDIHDCRSDCPLFKADSCELSWAQMPYAEDRKGEGDA